MWISLVNESKLENQAKQALFRLIGTSERQVYATYDTNFTSRALTSLAELVTKVVAEEHGRAHPIEDLLLDARIPGEEDEEEVRQPLAPLPIVTPVKRKLAPIAVPQGAGAGGRVGASARPEVQRKVQRLSLAQMMGVRPLNPERDPTWIDGEEDEAHEIHDD